MIIGWRRQSRMRGFPRNDGYAQKPLPPYGNEVIMQISEKLQQLRALMTQEKMDGYLVVSDDFHGSEYVGDYFKVREFLSGFTGSAGTLVVLKDWAGLWTDGRYFLQAEDQLAGSGIELMRSGEPGVPTIGELLGERLPAGGILGFDGRTVSNSFASTLAKALEGKDVSFAWDKDLADTLWNDRPALSKEPVWVLGTEYAGASREEKLARVRGELSKHADVLVLTALDEIAWLLNLRGNDVQCTPVFLAFMMISAEDARLYIHEEILSAEIRAKLTAAGITICPYEEIYAGISGIPARKIVWVDSSFASYRIVQSVPGQVRVNDMPSPVILMKSIKNATEMENMRSAHIKDGVALTRFMHWLKTTVLREKVTEISAAAKLEEFRQEMEHYVGPSFEPIVGYGPHGAIVHYEPTPETDVQLKPEGLCLVDTGGHYLEGTTDVTRTFVLGETTKEEKEAFTLVLKGHLNLGAAVFRKGLCGQNLDYLARVPLWSHGLDYNHGTGHGVGYLLSVHEGPQRIHWRITGAKPVPFEEGMITSNEPGVYLEGKFGIRHENLMLTRRGDMTEYGQMMYFENLTMVPFDLDGIDGSLLSDKEKELLNAYHRRVYETLAPWYSEEEREWLSAYTAAIR